jgi:U6 snRNA-associated Sm-like protein LSm2
VQLKNDMKIEGVLKSMDQNMNMELVDLNTGSLPPQLQNLKSIHVRGNSIRFISMDKEEIGKE